MPASLKKLTVASLAILVCSLLLVLSPTTVPEASQVQALAADGQLTWYRGNLHAHSLWSDGDDYLEMIGLWYKERDYDFLCFTDHNVLSKTERWTEPTKNKGGQRAFDKLKAQFPKGWVEERTLDGKHEVKLKTYQQVSDKLAEPGKFLLIQGEEITDRFKNLPIHMNASNIQELIPPLHGESVYQTMQNNVNAVVAQRERTGEPILIHLNHPNFGYGVTAEDLMRVRGENFFEVYNGHPGVKNSGDKQHASTEKIWDIILTKRLGEFGMEMMYGLATDDGHNYHDVPSRKSEPGRGWVMVLADELTPQSLIPAMELGRFYSSSGVSLKKVQTSKKGLTIEVNSEKDVTYKIEFIGTKKGYNPVGKPVVGNKGQEIPTTLQYDDAIGAVLKTATDNKATYNFTGDELYVRAVITSSKQHPNPSEVGEFQRAWSQPARGPAAMKTE